MLTKYGFLMEKKRLISVMETLDQGVPPSLTGILNSNAIVQTPMTLNILVAVVTEVSISRYCRVSSHRPKATARQRFGATFGTVSSDIKRLFCIVI